MGDLLLSDLSLGCVVFFGLFASGCANTDCCVLSHLDLGAALPTFGRFAVFTAGRVDVTLGSALGHRGGLLRTSCRLYVSHLTAKDRRYGRVL